MSGLGQPNPVDPPKPLTASERAELARKRVEDGLAEDPPPLTQCSHHPEAETHPAEGEGPGVRQPSPSADAFPIAARIASARDRKRLSQRQLADMTDIHHATLSTWERGEAMPLAGPLFRLANILGVDINWLLDPNSPLDNPTPPPTPCSPHPERSEGEGPGVRQPFQSALAFRRAVNIIFDAVINADHGLELVDLINAVDRVSDMLDDAYEMHSRQPSQPAGISVIRPSDDDTDTLAEHIIAELANVLLHLQDEHGWTPGKISDAAADLVNSTSCLDEQYAGRIADAMQSLAAEKSR